MSEVERYIGPPIKYLNKVIDHFDVQLNIVDLTLKRKIKLKN